MSTGVAESQARVESAAVSEPDWLAGELDHIVAAVTDRLARRRLPVATYRLQFNAGFTFRQALQIVPYLARLSVSDIYASPLLHARAGSAHGYDVVAHHEFNPELGTREDFDDLCRALRDAGLGLILDVVPNHMAASSNENAWWRDVLENGPASPYASYFDIDWSPVKSDLENKLLLPVLGEPYGQALEAGLLRVFEEQGAFWLRYHEQRFPLAPRSYAFVLNQRLDELNSELGADHPDIIELLSILTAISNLPTFTETATERIQERQREKEVIKRRLRTLLESSPRVAEHVACNVGNINGQPGVSGSFDRLDDLLQQQAYRLAYWRVAADEINYRRFFDVNDLAAICVENPSVFDAVHQLAFELLDAGQVTGLRIDHPDGLFDPPGYLQKLQERRFLRLSQEATRRNDDWPTLEQALRSLWQSAGTLPGSPVSRPLYVVVEKILEHDEPIPADWLTHGTVGYEFLNGLGGLLVNPAGAKLCTTTYARITGDMLEPSELAYRCKRLIVRRSMSSELTVLAHRLDRISERNRWTRDFTLNSLTHALEEVISCFEVYRTYVRPERLLERDRKYIEAAVSRAIRRNPAMSASIFHFVRDALLLQLGESASAGERAAVAEFAGKFQQLTGPIMAKAIEDTAFYRFNRLVCLNEVGGEPQKFGIAKAAFHRLNAGRLPQWSRGLSATSTHDTKRSEDVRARIAVLSEIAKEWRSRANRWVRQNARHKTNVDGLPAPNRGDEYLLYQTLVGIWPVADDFRGLPRFRKGHDPLAPFVRRVQQYMLKVAREAKLHTSWTNPNEDYERALGTFVDRLFQHRGPRSFVAVLDAFARRVAEHGLWNSLSQVALKIASPGVADFYQGTELWTLTLVDPDNRQPVDYSSRAAALDEMVPRWNEGHARRDALLRELLESRHDGRIKLFTTWRGLQARSREPALFADGEYLPAETAGRFAEHVVAFFRQHEGRRIAVLAPRWTVDVCGFGGPPPVGERWGDTAIVVPEAMESAGWEDVFTGRRHVLSSGSVLVASLLADWPVALLMNTD